mmetsp:Transcript_571/g.1592  ORF Transcript_571/g.1592 Transcript_571/m.1592 type:complete len:226 (-) Transcript_571:198-875(-)
MTGVLELPGGGAQEVPGGSAEPEMPNRPSVESEPGGGSHSPVNTTLERMSSEKTGPLAAVKSARTNTSSPSTGSTPLHCSTTFRSFLRTTIGSVQATTVVGAVRLANAWPTLALQTAWPLGSSTNGWSATSMVRNSDASTRFPTVAFVSPVPTAMSKPRIKAAGDTRQQEQMLTQRRVASGRLGGVLRVATKLKQHSARLWVTTLRREAKKEIATRGVIVPRMSV